ncbi:MAG: YoaK family protein [Thermoplasmata archaeon]
MSFLGLGQIFTANMTGNVVFLALAVGERSLPTALHSVVALIVFSLGAIGAGLLLVKPRPAGTWPQRVTWLLWGELACVASFALLWASADGSPGVGLLYLLIGLSSFGMGLQNAAARHLAVPGLTTTVVTGALTGFMVDLPALGISGPNQRRAGWAVVALFAGAAVGASLMVYARVFAPIVTVVTVAAIAAIAYRSFPAPTRTNV